MNLVVDANILVGELLRSRGRRLLQSSQLQLYIAQKALDETHYELRQRLSIMKNTGRLDESTEVELLAVATELIEIYLTPVLLSTYSDFETEARRRIPRDPNDWETVAVALALAADIWTEDRDFFGCGCAVWTTETLLLQVGK
jgi:predicted nucleic acid-binding protein